MKNPLRIQFTRRLAGLLLSAWLLVPGAWAGTVPPRTNSVALAGLVPSPASANTCVGGGFYTSVSVTGTGPFTYQWFKNQPTTADSVKGQITTSLSLYPLKLSDAGSYYLQVTGSGGVVWSEAFVLTVNPAMTASTPVLGVSTLCQGGSTTVSATFGGPASQGYFSYSSVSSPYGNGSGFTNYVTSGNTVTATFTPAITSSTVVDTLAITFTAINPAVQCFASSGVAKLVVKPSSQAYYFSLDDNTICQGGSTRLTFSFYSYSDNGGGTFSDGGKGGTFSDVSEYASYVSATYTPASNRTGEVSFTYLTTVPNSAGVCVVGSSSYYNALSINAVPTAGAVSLATSTVCQGGSTSVSATFGGSASSGSFNDGGVGGSFTNLSTNNKTVTATYTSGPDAGPVVIRFVTDDPNGPCAAATSTDTLTVNEAPTASATTLGAATICQGSSTSVSATFGGSASSGSFSDGGAGGAFTNISTSNKTVSATYTPAVGYSGTTTITFATNDPDGPCPAATSTATLTINPAATITTPTLGAASICQGGSTTVSVTFGGGVSDGYFYDNAGGSFTNVSTTNKTLSATYTPNSGFTGTATITARSDYPNYPCEPVTSTVSLLVSPTATASAITRGTSPICQGSTVSLSADFGGSATGGTFGDGAAGGSFSNVSTTGSTVSATYTPAVGASGSIPLTFTTTGPCTAVTTQTSVVVNKAARLTAMEVEPSVICSGGVSFVRANFGFGFDNGGYGGTFSDGGAGGTFTNPIYFPVSGQSQATYIAKSGFVGTITITFTTKDPDGDGPCPAVSSTLSLTVNEAPTASATTLGAATICQGSSTSVSATFGGSASSGSFSDGGAGGAFTNISTSNKTVSATYTPAVGYSGTTTITFATNAVGGCTAVTSTASLTVNPSATATTPTLGSGTICQGNTTTVSASFGGSAISGSFNDGGKGGSFSVTTLNGVVSGSYSPAAGYSGSTTITFTTNDPDGPCPAATSTVSLMVNPAATVTTPMLGAATICQGGSTSVSAKFGGGATSGSFSDGGAGGSFSVTTTNGVVSGSYAPAPGFSGPMTITFSTNDPDGPCPATIATVGLMVNPGAMATKPTLGAATTCQGGSTSVSASFGGSASGGSFSDGGVGGSFSVTTTNGVVSGTYTPAPGYSGLVTITFSTNDPDGPCGPATSSVNLTVNPTTAIQSLTPSQSICSNQPFTVSVSAVGANLTYQWYRKVNDNLIQAIPGATTASVALTNQYLPGTYYVVVSGQCGPSVTSPTFTLTYKPPTTLLVSSLVNQVCEGGNLTLSVAGNGPGSLQYSWRKGDPNGAVVGTGSSFTIQNAQVADAVTYYATVAGDCPSPTVSIPVIVRYLRITTEPQTVNLCSGNTTLSVGVQAVGLTPTYQWKKNGASISGATSSSYTVLSSRPGTYSVEVRTSCITLTSQGAVVGCANGRLAAETREAPRLEVAPNPASGQQIRCHVVGMENPEFGLTSLSGRKLGVKSSGSEGGEYVLRPTQVLMPGVYILQASEGTTRLSQRVLIVE